MGFRRRVRPILDLLFPPRCVYCGKLGAHLCEGCLAEAHPIGKDICIRCGNPMTQRGLCHRCRRHPIDPLRGIRGLFFYKGPISQGLRALKYQGVRDLAPILGRYLSAYIRDHALSIDYLIPVPLHSQRLAERGFNQSELLAQEVTETLGIPTQRAWLQRIRPTQPQAHLTREQRLVNVAGAFAVTADASLHGQTILLIDDVATTGATLRACAHALHQAGASEIWALTVARAHIHTVRTDHQPALSAEEAFLLWDGARRHS